MLFLLKATPVPKLWACLFLVISSHLKEKMNKGGKHLGRDCQMYSRALE